MTMWKWRNDVWKPMKMIMNGVIKQWNNNINDEEIIMKEWY